MHMTKCSAMQMAQKQEQDSQFGFVWPPPQSCVAHSPFSFQAPLEVGKQGLREGPVCCLCPKEQRLVCCSEEFR
jgi:hypothetical protein